MSIQYIVYTTQRNRKGKTFQYHPEASTAWIANENLLLVTFLVPNCDKNRNCLTVAAGQERQARHSVRGAEDCARDG